MDIDDILNDVDITPINNNNDDVALQRVVNLTTPIPEQHLPQYPEQDPPQYPEQEQHPQQYSQHPQNPNPITCEDHNEIVAWMNMRQQNLQLLEKFKNVNILYSQTLCDIMEKITQNRNSIIELQHIFYENKKLFNQALFNLM